MHRDYKESKRIDLICVFTTQRLSSALSAPGCNRWAQWEAEEVWDGEGRGRAGLCPHHGELTCELGSDSKKTHEQWGMAPSEGLVTHPAPAQGCLWATAVMSLTEAKSSISCPPKLGFKLSLYPHVEPAEFSLFF